MGLVRIEATRVRFGGVRTLNRRLNASARQAIANGIQKANDELIELIHAMNNSQESKEGNSGSR